MRGYAARQIDREQAAWVPPASVAVSDPLSAGPGLLASVLPGMVARGHGIDALCVYLAIARTALLNLVVSLGLATPHDRARRPGGRNSWAAEDIPDFIALWMAGWQAASLAERFGRKPTAIWAKARHLGLPRRDRKILFRPADPFCPARSQAVSPSEGHSGLAVRAVGATASQSSSASAAASPASASSATAPTAHVLAIGTGQEFTPRAAVCPVSKLYQARLPGVLATRTKDAGTRPVFISPAKPPLLAVPTANIAALNEAAIALSLFQDPPLPVVSRPTASVLTFPAIIRKGAREEVVWTTALDDEVANRHWAFQNFRSCARDMGISDKAIRSRKTRLELPNLPRGEQVEVYQAERAAPTIKEHKYTKKRCKAFWDHSGIEFYFWSHIADRQVRFSQLARGKRWFQEIYG